MNEEASSQGVLPLSLIWSRRREIRNWWWVLPLAALLRPSRIAGWGRPKFLGRIPIRVNLRSGLKISCRVNEYFQIIEVFLFRDYEHPAIPYATALTVLDVGANIGVATSWFSEVCPRPRSSLLNLVSTRRLAF